MKKFIITTLLIAFSVYLTAQVAINKDGSAPAAGSILHVKGTAGDFYIKDANGFVGIGTTNPSDKLHVKDGAFRVSSGTNFLTIQRNSSNFEIVSSDYLQLGTTSNRTLTIKDSKVGIGTDSPGEVLDVHGRIWVTGTGNSVFVGANAGTHDDFSTNQNVAVGVNAFQGNSTGEDNVSLGYYSMFANSNGSNNVAVGSQALAGNTTGADNIAIGFKALKINGNPFGTTTSNNIAIGAYAMEGTLNIFNPSDGANNIAIGVKSYQEYSDGDYNIGIGNFTLFNNKDGNKNIAIGDHAGPNADNLNNTIAIGDHAQVTADDQIVIGNNSSTYLKTHANMSVTQNNGALILKDSAGGCHAIRVDSANNITATTVSCP